MESPTHVGNTRPLWGCSAPGPVHPHACGEYLSSLRRQPFAFGSSPRVWGILGRMKTSTFCNRFIPTRVGNTVAG